MENHLYKRFYPSSRGKLLNRLNPLFNPMDLEEAKRLIREGGYRPYIRKSGGRRYITLKRGSRELSVGPYTEELWQALDSE